MLRVLVCDDAEPVRATLARALELSGAARVHTVATAEEALTVLASSAAGVDVVVMDQDLPGMTGFDAVRTMRDNGVDVPVLFFTADRAAGAEAACDPNTSYLCKTDAPIAQVVSTIRSVAAGGGARGRPE